MEPDFYIKYYRAAEHSPSHSLFCKEVFGLDLCQHGFADIDQLKLIVKIASIGHIDNAIDIGCGNGMITQYLSEITGARFTGLDNVSEAIDKACTRTANINNRLAFVKGDLNDLHLPPRCYDVALFIDTIYFSDNYQNTISQIKDSLSPKGRLVFLYSIGPALLGTNEFPKTLLEADKTPLAKVLYENGFLLKHIELTTQDYQLAKKRRDVLETLKEGFEHEGIGSIYQNRMGDSKDIIKAIEAGLHRRYLYYAQIS